MPKKNDIIICGDTHGEFKYLNRLINKKNPSLIIQCGDFGYWPKFDGERNLGDTVEKYGELVRKKWFLQIKNHDTDIWFCKGNHEDHDSLDALSDNEILPNVYYKPNGTFERLPDGRTVLFMGGAESVDRQYRTHGIDWFPQEIITNNDVYSLPADIKNVDIVISHTCPREFYVHFEHKLLYNGYKKKDCSMDALSYILETYKPKQWYFGHFHIHMKGYAKGCHWTALNMANNSNWWEVLK